MTEDDPWTISFDTWLPEAEQQREALFALGNGVLVLRNAVPWPHETDKHYPGTYLAGAYARFSTEIEGETVEVVSLANLPNPLPLTFRIEDGEWFTHNDARIIQYGHELDLRSGISCRDVTCEFRGRRFQLVVRQFVSMARPGIAALQLRIVPMGWSGRIAFRATIDSGVENKNVDRYQRYPSRHLARSEAGAEDGITCVKTRLRGNRAAITVAQRLDCATKAGPGAEQHLIRDAKDGVPIDLCKLIEVTATDPKLDQLRAAPDVATLEKEHRQAWDGLWAKVGIEADDPEIARLLRFHAFHLYQTVSPQSCALDAGIPARGWHGEGYRGHIFWDELFVFPFFLTRFPDIAKAKLLYRWRRLDAARDAAQRSGYQGAMFPWRSASDGYDVTPNWQWNMLSKSWMRDDTHHARHIGSAIAYNIWQYFLTTGDTAFLADHGAEIILEVARFWASKAEPNDEDDRYDIRGVVGPDEYHTAYPGAGSPGVDNNAYTNVTAVWTLCRALEVLDHVPPDAAVSLRAKLGITKAELALWDRISRKVRLAFHGDGILSQFEGFDRLEPLLPDTLPPHLKGHRLDWALSAVGQNSNSYQMSKQADTLTLFYLFSSEEVFSILERLGYAFDQSALERTCRYYFDRTMHRSSLSRVIYAGALAEADSDASLDLFRQALWTDLDGPKAKTVAEGVHMGAMGGVIDVLQRRYFGLTATIDGLRFFPSYPAGLCTMRIDVELRGLKFTVEGEKGEVTLRSHPCNASALSVVRPGGVSVLAPGETLIAGSRS